MKFISLAVACAITVQEKHIAKQDAAEQSEKHIAKQYAAKQSTKREKEDMREEEEVQVPRSLVDNTEPQAEHQGTTVSAFVDTTGWFCSCSSDVAVVCEKLEDRHCKQQILQRYQGQSTCHDSADTVFKGLTGRSLNSVASSLKFVDGAALQSFLKERTNVAVRVDVGASSPMSYFPWHSFVIVKETTSFKIYQSYQAIYTMYGWLSLDGNRDGICPTNPDNCPRTSSAAKKAIEQFGGKGCIQDDTMTTFFKLLTELLTAFDRKKQELVNEKSQKLFGTEMFPTGKMSMAAQRSHAFEGVADKDIKAVLKIHTAELTGNCV